MAAVRKKSRKNAVVPNYNDLKASDVICYVCRNILVEPVSSPCGHVFCLPCFEPSMQETSYTCPLCRMRISNWVRNAKKTNTLVNKELWSAIGLQFKEQVSLRTKGDEDGLDDLLTVRTPIVPAEPGETANEFKKLLQAIEGDRRKQDEVHEQASAELIQRLQQEEEEELRRNSIATENDEEFARNLQMKEDNARVKVEAGSSKDVRKSAKKQKVVKGPLDSFFLSENAKPKNGCIAGASRSASAGSADSICSELHYFKPIKIAPKTPTKQWPHGKFLALTVKRLTPDDNPVESKVVSPNKTIQSPFSAFSSSCTDKDDAETARKRLRFETEDESGVLKEINTTTNQTVVEEQLKIEAAILQEKADRELAMKLSKEWQQESTRSYGLRKQPRRSQQMGCKKQQTILHSLSLRSRK